MLKFQGFHFKKPALLSALILGLAMVALDASAQSEQEKTEENAPRPIERVVLEDHTTLQDSHTLTQPIRQSPKTTVQKKEVTQVGIIPEKETKRNESPSTLSFNIFLYVVDKFKAD